MSEARERREDARPDKPPSKSRGPAFVPMIVPWSVDLGPGFASLLEDDDGLRGRIVGLRQQVFHELGLPVPAPRIAIEPGLPAFAAVVSVREIPVATVMDGADAATQADVVVERARQSLLTHGHELLGIGETQLLLDALEEVNPAIVRQLVPKPIPVTLLAGDPAPIAARDHLDPRSPHHPRRRRADRDHRQGSRDPHRVRALGHEARRSPIDSPAARGTSPATRSTS